MDYTAPMPQKLNQTRSTTGGYQQATQPAGSGRIRDAAKTGMTMQPSPRARLEPVEVPRGFVGSELPADPNDAQSQQTQAPPIDDSIAAPAPVPTSATPSEGGESDSTPGQEPTPTGGVESPSYPALTDAAHPRGYPSQ